ncbi:flagellar biosynthesis anti-sigma factor FlgM [[Bacillus] enclensis]|jgi:negative regulator of flagellin synthesis FlgM|uniref:Negative regulator of flagellin synthesis n=1 Tax=[Bacillus] enclensis TaxID=1402860 RepID=A0A0V8HBQ4_9BACI|nr:flagellar biosynthesis anti-sigma factor FlgM [[Bacillus] enclensis]KSU59825.1 flagellar biosynthesis anti-sigma factor FlgM [[Bacillus] enclensis]QWC22398.1 flagellar biosynthesis anti-sigma factor FlgM [Bacillus haikouensis]SCC27755.1 anti-sigma-28 factor, FlgM family [[Bacillus] enclensis]
MKINNIGNQNINPYQRNMNKLNAAEKSGKSPSDKIEISTAAKEMQEVSKLGKERQAKVEALKDQVQSGNYTIDPKAIAKGLKNFYQS